MIEIRLTYNKIKKTTKINRRNKFLNQFRLPWKIKIVLYIRIDTEMKDTVERTKVNFCDDILYILFVMLKIRKFEIKKIKIKDLNTSRFFIIRPSSNSNMSKISPFLR